MKPGLYVATVRGVPNVVAMAHDDGDWFCTVDRIERTDHHLAEVVTDARPLVVLDPESDEDTGRMADALAAEKRTPGWHETSRRVLRALAAPTPAEPMGLGAVVRDRDGLVYTLVGGLSRANWCLVNETACRWLRWDQINSPEVLSEGWSE